MEAKCLIFCNCTYNCQLCKFHLQALEGLNRLSKGLTLQLCTVKRPAVGESLAAPLQAALRIPQVLSSPQTPRRHATQLANFKA